MEVYGLTGSYWTDYGSLWTDWKFMDRLEVKGITI